MNTKSQLVLVLKLYYRVKLAEKQHNKNTL